MAFGKSILAAGILVVAGFGGGFLLSNGSGQILGMKPPHTASTRQAEEGDANEMAAAAIVNAANGDGESGQDGKHPTLNQHGGGEGEGGEGATPAVAAGSERAAGVAGGGVAKGGPKRQTVALAGADAAAFLIGNTVDASLSKDGSHLTYYAPRGLRADGHVGSFLVKPWHSKAGSLCEPGSDGILVCRPAQVRGETGDHAPGAPIGTLLVAGDRWVPIYKGDRLGLPDHIPFIDSTVADAQSSAESPKPSTKGQLVVTALIGHAVSIDPPDGASDHPVTIVYFSDDGHRVSVIRPVEGADLSDGVAVSVGHWTASKGVFCQSDATLGAGMACSKPESFSTTKVRLISTKKAPDLRLTILTETPKPHLEAAN